MDQPYYSIIIPVYNESHRLPDSLRRLDTYLESLKHTWELVFIDDGSSDTTLEILRDHANVLPMVIVEQRPNQGKGWAVKTGMLKATGKYRAFLDADLATPPQELNKLFDALEDGADVAIGSRIQANGVDLRLVGKKPQPWIRRFLGKCFRLFATRPFLGNIRDSQCGAKAFTAEATELLFTYQQLKRWAFDIEILFLAKKAGMKVVEVPVDWEAVENSKLKPSISLAFDILKELAQIAWVHKNTRIKHKVQPA